MAQRRRREQEIKRRQRIITVLCIAGGLSAVLLSLVACIVIFDPFPEDVAVSAPAETAAPYDPNEPFSLNDLTSAQIAQIRKNGRMSLSDGPRDVSVGDTLETLLDRLPFTIVEMQENRDLTGLQSDEEMIIYCASYFENQNGRMTALPPRGLLTVDTGEIIVTLLAPTSAYPAGTLDSYGSYEHVYCVYTINPDTMTVSDIVIGIDT